jgi:hypothetical protein
MKKKDYIERKEARYIAQQTIVDYHIHRRKEVERRSEALMIGIFAGVVLLCGFMGVFEAARQGFDAGSCFILGLLYAFAAAIGIGAGIAVYTLATGNNRKDRTDYQIECFGTRD